MVIIKHIILCWFIGEIDSVFNLSRWDHVTLCGDLINFIFISIVFVINHIILCRPITDNCFIFNLSSLDHVILCRDLTNFNLFLL